MWTRTLNEFTVGNNNCQNIRLRSTNINLIAHIGSTNQLKTTEKYMKVGTGITTL